MSEPHEIKYRITVHAPGTSSGKIKSAEAKTAGSDGVKRGDITEAPEISGLKYRGREKLEAARNSPWTGMKGTERATPCSLWGPRICFS